MRRAVVAGRCSSPNRFRSAAASCRRRMTASRRSCRVADRRQASARPESPPLARPGRSMRSPQAASRQTTGTDLAGLGFDSHRQTTDILCLTGLLRPDTLDGGVTSFFRRLLLQDFAFHIKRLLRRYEQTAVCCTPPKNPRKSASIAGCAVASHSCPWCAPTAGKSLRLAKWPGLSRQASTRCKPQP